MAHIEPVVFKRIDDALPFIAQLRDSRKSIVTTNGCFDLIHSGHVRYLYDAASKGGALIVGINSDASVARLKGPQRPVQKELDHCSLEVC
jgi:D-beta-D-heptose 7-phosphate kinase/D-beta-D-heptose 1-phosphate adenosyltransferase